MFLCTVEQMRSIDRRTIDQYHIDGFALMERAGGVVTQAAIRMLGKMARKRVEILCGKGNNGGDGFVIGRLLTMQDADVRCLLLGERSELSGDAQRHMSLAEQVGVPIEEITEASRIVIRQQADLIVDAILGTGLKGPARGLVSEAITRINLSCVPVLSVDIPSGFTPNMGAPESGDRPNWLCVRADRTVTIGLMKVDLATYPGKAWAGQIDVADIGFPTEAIEAEKLWLTMPTAHEMSALMPRHTPGAHKGDCGRAVVVAGSVGMAGAAALTAHAAMRTGAGMAILGTPVSMVDIFAVKLTEVMTRPLPETPERTLSLDAESAIRDLSEWGDILAIGPGLSRHAETSELVRRVVSGTQRPMVIDADGLNAFAGHADELRSRKTEAVITPHTGELSRLIDLPAADILTDRIGVARQTAERLDITVVLKGMDTVVAAPTGPVSINPTGNPGMATAGSGDVLTGIIAGLMAQGLPVFDAAVLGVYLHGLSGDLAAAALGQHSLMAGDLITWLPKAIIQVERGCIRDRSSHSS